MGPTLCDAIFECSNEGSNSLITLLIDSGSFTDRVDTTGILEQPGRARFSASSVWRPRASGIDADLRRDHPPRCVLEPGVRGPRRKRRET
jgi:Ni,Fe-hydrogenase III large subunit